MSPLSARLRRLGESPRFTLVRGVARFPLVRAVVARCRSLVGGRRTARFLATVPPLSGSLVSAPAAGTVVADLRRDGFALGLTLDPSTVANIVRFAEGHPVYADRDPALGFHLDDRPEAEAVLGKPVLVAQYFNTQTECPEIAALATDPLLQTVAAEFLGSVPTLVGSSLWWTFPVDADEADRARHAHRFHRDVDDFAFVKFFFYLTDVGPSDGGHVCVRGSHRGAALPGWKERLRIRRYSDAEIEAHYGVDRIVEITGSAGTGFAENTLCIHKGLTPERSPRLLLQFEFALFDHGVMHDRRSTLESVAAR